MRPAVPSDGVSLFNAGRHASALAAFERGLRLRPRSPELRLFMGHCLEALGRRGRALQAFEVLRRLRPGYAPGALALAGLLRRMRRLGAAEAAARRGLSGAPRSRALRQELVGILRTRALGAQARERVEEAIAHWKQVLALDKSHAEAKKGLGELLWKRAVEAGATGDAAAGGYHAWAGPQSGDRDRGVAAVPWEGDSWHRIVALSERETFADAARLMRRPNYGVKGPVSAVELAQAAFRLGDWPTARRWCRRALGSGSDPETTLAVARMLRAMGLKDPARTCMRRGLKRPRGAPGFCARAGAALESIGLYGRAARFYAHALRRDPRNPAALLGLGRLRAWAGDLAGAGELSGRLMRLGRVPPEALTLAGAVRVLRGEPRRALVVLREGLRRPRPDPEAFLWAAEAAAAVGRTGRAFRLLTAAQRRDANPLLVSLLRIVAAARAGRPQLQPDLITLEVATPPALRPRRGAPAEKAAAMLRALNGNRSSAFTKAMGRGPAGLRACPAPHPRKAMLELHRRMAYEPAGKILAAFKARIAHERDPVERARWRVHRGELYLWQGRYRQALADIRAGLPFRRLCWPPAGAAGACVMLGRYRSAFAYFKQCLRRGTPERVWRPWRGEALRRMGRLREARRDLEWAMGRESAQPAALVNLALAYGASGRSSQQRDFFAMACHVWPLLAAQAAVKAGLGRRVGAGSLSDREVSKCLEAVLGLMRGNRSNWLPGFFAPGRAPMRVLVSSLDWAWKSL